MGIIDRRLEALEATFAGGSGSGAGDLQRELFREAFRRLSVVEMSVMEELNDAYRSRPGTSPAWVWRELTEAQRAMETHWRTTVGATAREMIDADPGLSDGQRGPLKRDAMLAVANAPFWRGADDGAA